MMERELEKLRCGAGGTFGGAKPGEAAGGGIGGNARLDGGGGVNSGGRASKAGECWGACACDFAEVQAVLGPRAHLAFGWVYAAS